MKELVKNRKNKLVKTTFFMAMFVTALMLLSSIVPAANQTSSEIKTFEKGAPLFSTGTSNTLKTDARVTLASELQGHAQEAQPLGSPITWIHYNDDTEDGSLGLTAGGNWQFACRFTPDELAAYAGYGLTTVQFYFNRPGYEGPAMDLNVIIYGEGTSTTPGDILYQEAFTADAGEGWRTFTLAEPQPVPGDAERWVAINLVAQPSGYFPAGMTSGATAGKGDWVSLDGSSWIEITIYGFDYDFMIWAGVEAGGPTVEHDLKMKSINAPITGTAAQAIIPKATVKNQGNNTETDVDVTFKVNGLSEFNVYNEGFEGVTFPPVGWFTYIYGGYFVQASGSQSNGLQGAYSGTYGARAYAYGYGYSVQANTPSFDGSLGGNTLTFAHNEVSWAGDIDYLYLYGSNDGGMSYYYITGWTSAVPSWTVETINLDNYVPPSNNMQVVFYCILEYGYGVYIDDVNVNGMAMSLIYENTQTIASIASGEEKQVEFTAWNPAEWNDPAYENSWVTYGAEAQVFLTGDQDPSNDYKSSMFELYYPYMYDVCVNEIISPVDDAMAQTFDVKASIKNVGQNPVKDFFTQVDIGTVGIAGTPLYENWNTGGSYSPPVGWVDEHKSIYYYYGWWTSYSNQAGGTSPEGYLPYYYCYANYKLISPTINMAGFAGGELTYKMYDNHYSGQGLYSWNVGVSTDGGATWTTVIHLEPGSSGLYPGEVSIPGGSANTKIAFWIEGNPFYFNYIYLDDIQVQCTYVISEYQWDQAVTEWFNPGEVIEQTFHDWTPEHLVTEPYESGVISYLISAETQYPGDSNTGNDIMGDGFKLTYLHDIGLTITSPQRSEEKWYAADALGYNTVWFDPANPSVLNTIGPYSTAFLAAGCWADGQWYVSPYGTGVLYTVDTATGVLTTIGGSVANGYTGLAYTAGQMYGVTWTGSGVNLYKVDKSSGVSTLVGSGGYYLFIDMCIDKQGVAYGHDIIYDQICKIDLSTAAVTVVGPTGISANYAQGMSYDLNGDQGYLAAYTYGGGLYKFDKNTGTATNVCSWSTEVDAFAIPGGGPGPQTPTVFVKTGTTGAISATAKNVGTWEETTDAYANVTEYITDPNNATFVDEWSVPGVVVTPLGGTTPISFGTMSWAMEGIYNLYVEIPLAVDDKQSDNKKTLGVGSDATPPVTTHTVTPASPDGLNGWYKSDVTIKLTAADPEVKGVASKVAKIEYQVDGGAWQTYTAPFKVTTDNANHIVKYHAIDKVGNQETDKQVPAFKIDKTKPVIAMNYTATGNPLQGYQIIVTVTATDAMSGMQRVEFYFNEVLQSTVTGPGPTYVWNYTYAPLPKVTIKAIAYDFCGLNNFVTIEDPKEVSYESQQIIMEQQILLLK